MLMKPVILEVAMSRSVETEDQFFTIKSKLLEAINYHKTSSASSTNSTIVSTIPTTAPSILEFAKLPTIALPTFDGSYDKWMSFKDRFTALVAKDTRLTPALKLHYLKSCLTGPPADLVKSKEITDDNYQVVWTMLQNRYGKKKLI